MVIHRNKSNQQHQAAIDDCNNDNGVLLASFIAKQSDATDAEKTRASYP
jgi:hypothetical protein